MGPVTPFIPLIAQGAGALFGGMFGSKPSSQMSAAMGPMQQAQNLGIQNAQSLMPQGQNLMTNAAQAMNPVLNYYSRLLSGDRGAMTQVLAPQLNQIGQAYQAQQNAQNQLMPRGGGRAGLMSQLPYAQTQNMLNLFQNARSGAAQGLSGAAGQIGQLGSSLIGSANNSLMASTSAGRDLLNTRLPPRHDAQAELISQRTADFRIWWISPRASDPGSRASGSRRVQSRPNEYSGLEMLKSMSWRPTSTLRSE